VTPLEIRKWRRLLFRQRYVLQPERPPAVWARGTSPDLFQAKRSGTGLFEIKGPHRSSSPVPQQALFGPAGGGNIFAFMCDPDRLTITVGCDYPALAACRVIRLNRDRNGISYTTAVG
jgi:hypothetical protein